jgi:hypothetical protein
MTNLNFVAAVEVEVLRPRKARAPFGFAQGRQDDKFLLHEGFDYKTRDYS